MHAPHGTNACDLACTLEVVWVGSAEDDIIFLYGIIFLHSRWGVTPDHQGGAKGGIRQLAMLYPCLMPLPLPHVEASYQAQ